ncbi:MAG TPA: site-2 protease family protein, partial [Pirellulales bacterium]|nr:site-2 protease family protein [Pirellulales bacterium]
FAAMPPYPAEMPPNVPAPPLPKGAHEPEGADDEGRSQAGPLVPQRPLDEFESSPPRFRRRIVLPLFLFLATCASTFMAGVYSWAPEPIDGTWLERIRVRWADGLIYMAAVMAVLLAHEMGHFLMTIRYRIPASYPIFIPMPIIMTTGTMGAVIGMDGLRADRRQLFDIGLAGPLAGLVLTVPLVCIGLMRAVPTAVPHFGEPLLVKLLLPYLRPELAPNMSLHENALYMAGWVGMLVTGLNMMPVSQLDGGHIIYGLLGRRSRWVARAFLLSAMALIVISENYTWLMMLLLVTLLGADHPPTANDRVRIGPLRWLIGAASLAIPVLCFMPTPLNIDAYEHEARIQSRSEDHPAISNRAAAGQKIPAPKLSDLSGVGPLTGAAPTDVGADDPADAITGTTTESGCGAGALCGGRGCCSAGST